MKILNFDDKKEIKQMLLKNEVIAFPTETVFGLGVVSTSGDAFANLVKVKNRSPEKPFTLMCSNKNQIKDYAIVSPVAEKLINKYMPGSITLLLPAKEHLDYYLTLNSKFIGVRIADIAGLTNLIEYVGVPLLVPSANKANEKPATSINDVISVFEGEIACCIDGVCVTNLPSTIIEIDECDNIILIRKGPISFEEIIKEAKK
ncbi:MAG: L-threonylcarbamoyladenylate synthase [Bacilli bacterium]